MWSFAATGLPGSACSAARSCIPGSIVAAEVAPAARKKFLRFQITMRSPSNELPHTTISQRIAATRDVARRKGRITPVNTVFLSEAGQHHRPAKSKDLRLPFARFAVAECLRKGSPGLV